MYNLPPSPTQIINQLREENVKLRNELNQAYQKIKWYDKAIERAVFVLSNPSKTYPYRFVGE